MNVGDLVSPDPSEQPPEVEAMYNRVRLLILVDRLERLYETARAKLQARIDTSPIHNCTPEEMITTDGRFILLDSLCAIVSARAVLAAYPERGTSS